MKAIRRVAGVLLWFPVIVIAGLHENVREALKKRRLGAAYEGPLED